VLLALVAGIIGTTIGMLRAMQAEVRTNKALAAVSEEQTKRQAALAAEMRARQQTRQALSSLIDDIVERQLAQQPVLGPNEKLFLRRVQGHFEAFTKEQGETEEARATAAGGEYQVAKIRAFLGDRREAEEGYRAVIARYEQLAADFPDVDVYRQNLGGSYNNLAVLLGASGRQEDAAAACGRALKLREQLAAKYPTVPKYRQELAASYNNLGVAQRELKQRDQARASFDKALELRESLVSMVPAYAPYRQELATSHMNMGILLRDMRKLDEAATAQGRAVELLDKVVAENPGAAAYRRDLASALNSLGIVLALQKKQHDAETAFRRSMTTREQLAAMLPAVPDYQIDVAGSYVNFGRVIRDYGRTEEALDWFGKAIALLETVLKRDNRVAAAREFLRNAYASRAESLDLLNRPAESAAAWERAIEFTDVPTLRNRFRVSRTVALARGGDYRVAGLAADDLAQSAGLEGGALYNLGCVYALCATAAKEDAAQREMYAAKAVAQLRRAKAAGLFQDANHFENLKKDSDLEAVRQREDYRILVKELEANQ
jgi:tetratricopeptide (TPR) repeat protein